MSANASRLSVIVDCNPICWGRILDAVSEEQQCSLLLGLVNDLATFCNVHCLQNPSNKLLLLGAGLMEKKKSCILFSNEVASTNDVHETVKSLLLNAVTKDKESGEQEPSMETRLAGPLTNALCYTNRMKKQQSGSAEQFRPRILIVKLGEGMSTEHLNLMSGFFAAQKQGVVIDACTLTHKSAVLQQASDITGGICLDVAEPSGLLQYLLTVFLPNPEDREKMHLPSLGDVDYRPACFCHQELLSTGWVCSVCLSVFCKFTPICPTCQTAFKFLPAMSKLKKRKKTDGT